jgi:hypothetical protein
MYKVEIIILIYHIHKPIDLYFIVLGSYTRKKLLKRKHVSFSENISLTDNMNGN